MYRKPKRKLWQPPRMDVGERLYQWRRGLGVTGIASLIALAAIGASVVILDASAGNRRAAALGRYLGDEGQPPVELIASAARSHRLLFIGDIAGAPEPKRIAADAIAAIATGSGLDAVVLAIPAEEQPFIDRYLNSVPEDASLLLARPHAIREGSPDSREILDLYRRVWSLNRKLGPERSIRIVAADTVVWPSDRALAPRAAAELYARRSAFMADRVERSILSSYPRSRIVFLVDGYQALKGGSGSLNVGGSSAIDVEWLAARLADDHPTEVYTVLIEGRARRTGYESVAAYDNTRFFDMLRKSAGLDAPVAVPVDRHFAFASQPVLENTAPGLELTILPRDYRLADVADAYVYLGSR